MNNRDNAKRLALSLLRDGYNLCLQSKGSSMAPLIRQGDRLTVKPCCYREIRIGDIVVYEDPKGLQEKRFTAHRCLMKKRDDATGEPILLTRGDATRLGACALVKADQVVGKIIAVEKGGRRISLEGFFPRLFAWPRVLLSSIKAKIWQIQKG